MYDNIIHKWLMTCLQPTIFRDPGLFSLISSLHKAHQDAVREDPLLYPLLQDQASRPPQTYCYVFIVSLGLTNLLHTGEEVVLPVTLPHWSLHEALQVSFTYTVCNM